MFVAFLFHGVSLLAVLLGADDVRLRWLWGVGDIPCQAARRCIASALRVDCVGVVDGEVDAVGWGGSVGVDGGERANVEVESVDDGSGGYEGGDGG